MLPLGRNPRPVDLAREPDELLIACHGRIRHFAEVACKLAEASEAPPEQVVEAASSLQRYFTVALPLHERDEEDSLAPRLLESPARMEVEDALARMVEQHRIIDALVERMIPVWARVAASPGDLADVADELDEGAQSLVLLFEPHLAIEEMGIFPALGRSVTEATRRVILQEMKARRTPEVRAEMSALHV